MAGSCSSEAAESAAGPPATAKQAAKVLDLATFPLMPGVEAPKRVVASLFYKVASDAKTAFEFQRKQLLAQKWKELPGGSVTDQSASGTFAREGYCVSVMTFPTGNAGEVSVAITQHGNVALGKLPLPPGAKSLYAGPVSAMFVTEAPVDMTTEACQKLLLAKGWQPYGTAGDSHFYKQNGIRLNATIMAGPAQGGKTMITYSCELMSVDLPAPADTINLQYADSTAQLIFDSEAPIGEIADFYRETLAKAGWTSTLENPVKIEFKDVLIFRNPEHDMLRLEMYEIDGKNRIILGHQSADEIAELDRLIKLDAAKRQLEKDQPLPKLVVSLPPEAKKIEQTKARIEFELTTGKAKAWVQHWRKEFTDAGWKEEQSNLEPMAGSVSWSKEKQSLHATYTDTGFLPAEITLSANSVELEQAADQE